MASLDETRIGRLRPDEPDVDLSIEQCMPLLHRSQVLQPEVDVPGSAAGTLE
jgi:hypothetical protein